jgi:hypothetical protein
MDLCISALSLQQCSKSWLHFQKCIFLKRNHDLEEVTEPQHSDPSCLLGLALLDAPVCVCVRVRVRVRVC